MKELNEKKEILAQIKDKIKTRQEAIDKLKEQAQKEQENYEASVALNSQKILEAQEQPKQKEGLIAD